MPITDIGSYVTTGSEFEAHWTDVDADRIANSLAAFALPDGFALADLSTAVAAVTAAITSQESSDNALSIATSGRVALALPVFCWCWLSVGLFECPSPNQATVTT